MQFNCSLCYLMSGFSKKNDEIWRFMKKVFFLLLYFVSSAAFAGDDWYSWVQFNSAGKMELRYVANNNKPCPKAIVNGQVTQMQERAKTDKLFPHHICQSQAYDDIDSVEIDQTKIQLASRNHNKILIIGDTGCAENEHDQDCSNTKDWPLAKIAETIKNKEQYDYAIHVGDFHYDTEDFSYGEWRREFLEPMQPILNKAPWIFVRGNHEDCNRAGEGWMRLLSPFPYQTGCIKNLPLYEASLGKYRFIVMDNSSSHDVYDKAKTPYEEVLAIRKFSSEFSIVGNMAKDAKNRGQTPIFLMHKPIFGVDQVDGKDKLLNVTMESAARPKYVEQIALVISGHVHAWEALSVKDDKMPPQIIVGNGGNALIKGDNRFANINRIAKSLGVEIGQFAGKIEFGYATLSTFDDLMVVEFKSVDGDVVKTCKVQNRQLSCS